MTGSPASSIAAADIEAVRQGELRLLEADVRASPNEIDALLADEFVEYGSSGRILDKAETMAALRAEAGEGRQVERDVADLVVRPLGPDAMLVTYRVHRRTAGGPEVASLRSSVWARSVAGWRMLFHQGTRLTTTPTLASRVVDIVAAGYDRIADDYLARFGRSAVRDAKLAEAVALLRPGASVLDLGCGAGVPVARALVEDGFGVTGIDVSRVQVENARRNVPGGRFIHGDVGACEFPSGSFDAVLAFYVFNHVQRERQDALLARLASWLKPGGILTASFGVEEGDWSGEWLGVEMHFSHHAPETIRRLVRAAGFAIETCEILRQDDEPTSFLWITARLPRN